MTGQGSEAREHTENSVQRIKLLQENRSISHFTAGALVEAPAQQPVVTPSIQNPRPILMVDLPGEEFVTSHDKDSSIVYQLKEAAVDCGYGDYWAVRSGLSPQRRGLVPDHTPDAVFQLRYWVPEERQRYKKYNHYTRFRAGYLAITPPHKRHVVYPIRFGPHEGAIGSWNLSADRPQFHPAPQLENVTGDFILMALFDTGCVVTWWSEWLSIDGLKIPGGYTARVKTWIDTHKVTAGWDQVHAKIISMINMPRADDCAIRVKEVLDIVSRLPLDAENDGDEGASGDDASVAAGGSDRGEGSEHSPDI